LPPAGLDLRQTDNSKPSTEKNESLFFLLPPWRRFTDSWRKKRQLDTLNSPLESTGQPRQGRGEEQQATKRRGGEEQLTTSGLGYELLPTFFICSLLATVDSCFTVGWMN
jgi:hypothetical protein